MELKDVRSDLDLDMISLVKLTGKRVEDILCRVGDPFATGQVTLQIEDIILEDGTSLYVDGEHDYAYLANYGEKIVSREVLEQLYKEN